MISPLFVALAAFGCIFGGTFLGALLRRKLPEHHLSGDTKDIVRLGSGLIGTIAALVLGLLIASANGTFESQRTQIKQLTANIILLDRILTRYGPEADSARSQLRHGVAAMADRIWRENGADSSQAEAFEGSSEAQSFYDEILNLSPQNEVQRSLKARALDTSTDVARTRLILFAKAGGALPMPFLVVLILWLTIIFASFSLFADTNATAVASLCVFAFSASAAIFLILELSQPFSGVLMISDQGLRNALAPLGS